MLRLVRFSQALTSHLQVIIASLPSISASKQVFQHAYTRRSCLYAPRKTADSTMLPRRAPPRAAHLLSATYRDRNTLSAVASALYTPGWVTVDPGCRREDAYSPLGAHICTSCAHTHHSSHPSSVLLGFPRISRPLATFSTRHPGLIVMNIRPSAIRLHTASKFLV